MIQSFKNAGTKDIFDRTDSKAARKLLSKLLWPKAVRLLHFLNAAHQARDMKVPPGNGLEQLTKDRAGQWSVRINDQFRICFTFDNGNANDVEIVDYH